jgi:hypothetical protein
MLVASTGLAKLGYHPGEPFVKDFVDVCMGRQFRGFKSVDLANVLHGEWGHD